MTITQSLSIVRCILHKTDVAAESETVNGLADDPKYYRNLKRRSCLNAGEHPEINARGSLEYAMRGQKLCCEDFATLNGLNVHTITRHGTDITFLWTILLYEKRHIQLSMGKLGLHRQMID